MSVSTQRHLASSSVWTWGSVQVPGDTEIHSNTELEECELSYCLGDKFYSHHVNTNPADIVRYPRVIIGYWNYLGNIFLNPSFVSSWEKENCHGEKENCHEENVIVVEVYLQQSQKVSKASSEFKYIMCKYMWRSPSIRNWVEWCWRESGKGSIYYFRTPIIAAVVGAAVLLAECGNNTVLALRRFRLIASFVISLDETQMSAFEVG